MTHFQDSEFTCRCGRPACDAPKAPHRLLRLYLDRAREMYGQPIVVTSGNRCAVANVKVDGEKDSEHLFGYGADVACVDSSQRARLLDAFRHAGLTRVGIYRNPHLHVGVGDMLEPERWPPAVVWVK